MQSPPWVGVDICPKVRTRLMRLKRDGFVFTLVLSSLLSTAPGNTLAEDSKDKSPPANATGSSNSQGPEKCVRGIDRSGWTEAFLGAYINQNGALTPTATTSGASPEESRPLPIEPERAALLKEFGCLEFARKTLARGQRRILIDVFEFPTSSGAWATYNYLRRGASTVVTRGDGSSEDDLSVSFWQDRRFIQIVGSEDDDETKDVIHTIADQLGKGMKSHANPPAVLSWLPVIDRVKGTEKLVMGPLSGRRFFPAPYTASLSLDKAHAAAVADYQFSQPPERMKLLLVEFGDPAIAASAYNNYVSRLNETHQLQKVDSEEPVSVYKSAKTYVLAQTKGSRLIVVSGARKKYSPLMLARQVN